MPNGNLPVLARDRLDYAHGAYEVSVKRAERGTGMAIGHAVSGRNLVSHLLKRSEAAFAVEVSAPYATYRRICLAEVREKVDLVQTVSWDAKDIVPPVYVRPLVVATATKTKRLELNGRHGVHEVWRGVEVEIAPGAILAADQFWRTASTWESLIRLVSNVDLPAGTYRIEMNTGEGFHFRVQMNEKLFEKMVSPGEDHRHCQTVLTACLARGLEMVKDEYGREEKWREFPVLRALHEKLIGEDLGTWEDEQFRPEEVATRLKPIEFGVGEGG